MSAKVRRRLPALRARVLARRALTVPHDLPLAEAVRRAQDEQAGSIVVLDATGRTSGIVNEAAVQATPRTDAPGCRSARCPGPSSPGSRLSADLSGEALIRAMQRTPASEYLLLDEEGSVFGVLVTEDVDRAFSAAV